MSCELRPVLSSRKRRRSSPPADEKTAAGPEFRRQLVFDDRFLQDLRFWVQTDPRVATHLLKLVDLIMRDPFHGKGKPEPLKRVNDTWSRRLTQEHRITYLVTNDQINFLQARFHYPEQYRIRKKNGSHTESTESTEFSRAVLCSRDVKPDTESAKRMSLTQSQQSQRSFLVPFPLLTC